MAAKKKNSTQANLSSASVLPQSLETYFLPALAVVILLVFSHITKHTFINYDDTYYILGNESIKAISWANIKTIFSEPVLGMYNPLPFLLYSVEYALWGFNARNFLMVNLLIHILASFACYYFIRELTHDKFTALVVCLLFALHPMHVSVVAWSSQTKTSLYTLFYFLALRQYLFYSKHKLMKNYGYMIVFLVLSLLSKPSAISFIGIIFLIDYYKTNSIIPRDIISKIPVFLLCLSMGLINLLTHYQTDDNIFKVSDSYNWLEYILIANYSFAFYLEKVILPFNLSMIYPYPKPGSDFALNYYITLLVIPVLAYIWYKAKTFRKDFVFGLLFFMFSIALMIRVVPSGEFGMGNQYTYLSFTGLFFIISRFFVRWHKGEFQNLNAFKQYAMICLVTIILFFSLRTVYRVSIWENSISVFSDVIKKYPWYETAYNHRALAKAELGDYRGAIEDLNMVIAISPTYMDAYLNRGEFYADLEKFDLAIADFKHCLTLSKDEPSALINLGQVLFMQKQYDEALIYLDKVIANGTTIKEAYYNRGLVHAFKGNDQQSLEDLYQAEKLGLKEARNIIEQVEARSKPNHR